MTEATFSPDRRAMMGLAALGLAAAALPIGANAALANEPAGGAPPKTGLTPDQALARLQAGNSKFLGNNRPLADLSNARRLALAKGQAPYAALVGCADSRVSPEHLFGEGLGELFVVRTAGNYVDDAGLGSLAYSVAALGVPLIVVVGHERCGAVDAATKLVTGNKQLPPVLTRMVEPILPAVVDAQAHHASQGGDLLDHAIHYNVSHVVKQLRESRDPLFSEPLSEGKLKIVGAYYDLDTGKVEFFDRG